MVGNDWCSCDLTHSWSESKVRSWALGIKLRPDTLYLAIPFTWSLRQKSAPDPFWGLRLSQRAVTWCDTKQFSPRAKQQKRNKQKSSSLGRGWIVPPSLGGSKARNCQGLEQGSLSTEANGYQTCHVPNSIFTLGSWDNLKTLCIHMVLAVHKLRALLAL